MDDNNKGDDGDDYYDDDDDHEDEDEWPVLWSRVAAQVHWETRVEAVMPLQAGRRWLGKA